jgi:hypothetical protein
MSVECFDGFVDLFFEQKIFHLACATSYNINVGQNSYTAYRYGHESLRGAWGWSMSAELRSEACERLKQDFLNIKDVLGDLTDDVLIFLSNQDVPRIKRAIASLDDCPGEAIFNLTQDPDASISSIAKEHKRLKEMSAFI